MKRLIKDLEEKIKSAKRLADQYRESQEMANDDDARHIYEVEKNFWLGMQRAFENALTLVVQEEATGGTPF